MNLGFGTPEDWFPEDEEEIEATKRLYDILNGVIQRGFQIELLDCWSGAEDADADVLDVSLSQVPRDQFRLFEGHLFTLKP